MHPSLPLMTALCLWAAAIAVFDWRQQRVPNAMLILIAVPVMLALLWQKQGLLGESAASSVLGAVLGFALTFPGYRLRRLGAGDVKFASLLGLMLGTVRSLEMVLWASLLMGATAVLAWRIKGSRDAKFPAAPSLTLAFVVEMLGGPLLLQK